MAGSPDEEAALPRTHSPAQRHAFEAPLHFDADAAASVRTRELHCTCARSPWCRGALSADWADCSSSCRACKAPHWQPPAPASVQAEPGDLNGQ